MPDAALQVLVAAVEEEGVAVAAAAWEEKAAVDADVDPEYHEKGPPVNSAVQQGNQMKIAVASGKGGTGKTTVSVSLALASRKPVTFVDCDVEEPNAHIFLKPEISGSETFFLIVPQVIEDKCTYCGKCRDICQFNAITVFGHTIMAFADMCHSCGGCFLVCDEKALREAKREIGRVEWGTSGEIKVFQATLRVGEAMASPLIKAVKKRAEHSDLVIFDAPPGTSCPVINTVRDADYVLLVTEPTPFGLHDLKLAAAVMKELHVPFGVILNKAGIGFDKVNSWCRENNIPLHMEIPFDRDVASAYARGIPVIDAVDGLRKQFESLLEELEP